MNKKGLKKLVGLLLVLVFFVSSGAMSVRAETISSAQQKAKELEQKKKQAEKEKASLSAQVNTIIAELEKAQADVAAKEEEIVAAEDELIAAKIKENEQYERMKIRIKYMYENGDAEMISILLSAEDMGDFLNKAEYVEQISSYDREMLVVFQNLVKEVEEKEARLQEEKERLVALQDTLSAKKTEVETLLASKKTEISKLESEIGANAKVLEKLLAEAKEAERRRKEAAQSSKGGGGTPTGNVIVGNGRLANPCPGARITSEFGYRTAPTAGATANHAGRDMAAPTGTPIYAADGGRVIRATYNSARGNYIVVDHGNGMQTWYQHCSQLYVSTGAQVTRGQNIAAIGTTGVSTGPHLHFEVHVNGTPVDPRNYL